MTIAVEYDVGWDSRMTVLGTGRSWDGMVWYGMAWHGMGWDGMVWYGGKPE